MSFNNIERFWSTVHCSGVLIDFVKPITVQILEYFVKKIVENTITFLQKNHNFSVKAMFLSTSIYDLVLLDVCHFHLQVIVTQI